MEGWVEEQWEQSKDSNIGRYWGCCRCRCCLRRKELRVLGIFAISSWSCVASKALRRRNCFSLLLRVLFGCNFWLVDVFLFQFFPLQINNSVGQEIDRQVDEIIDWSVEGRELTKVTGDEKRNKIHLCSSLGLLS